MPHLPTLPTFKSWTSPLSKLGVLTLGWRVVLGWVCLGRPLPLEPPLHVFWVCIPGPPVVLAPLEETLVALTADTRFLTCPTRASIWCCWYLSCLASSSSLEGGTVAAATLALGGFDLTCPTLSSSSAFLHSSRKCI